MSNKIAVLLEDEWLMVRYSGETPEIALHSAIYHLTVSNDGPQLTLTEEQLALLRQAAVDRFHEIITRDLRHANHGTSSYRGIHRSIINYRRFCTFCERQRIGRSVQQEMAAAALLDFLEIEMAEIRRRQRPSIINCSYAALKSFAADLGIDLDLRYTGLAEFCIDVE